MPVLVQGLLEGPALTMDPVVSDQDGRARVAAKTVHVNLAQALPAILPFIQPATRLISGCQ
jgi:hypothetical protein